MISDFGTKGGGRGLYRGPGLPLRFSDLGKDKAGKSPIFRLIIEDSRFLSKIWLSRLPHLDAIVDVDLVELCLVWGMREVVIKLLRW